MRLIDADAYADEMRKKQDKYQAFYESAKEEDARNYWKGVFMTFVEAKITLDNIPTANAVPVVRCKDCEYGKEVSDTKGCVWCTCYEIHKSLNGFCEYGEWKKWKDGEYGETKA